MTNILAFSNSWYNVRMAYFTDRKDFLVEEYVNKKKTIVQIGKEVGISYSTVQNGLKEHEIETDRVRCGKWKRDVQFINDMKKRLRGTKYPPKSMEIREKYKLAAKKRLIDYPHEFLVDKNYKSRTGLKHAMKMVYGKTECYSCGWKEHPEILHVHHKDMNHTNNTLKNCIWLCPNCHALIHYKEK